MSETDSPVGRNQEKLRRIAYHEAGHVVAAIVVGDHVESVQIDPAALEGETCGKPNPHSTTWQGRLCLADMELPDAEDRALFAFAGDAAEMHLIGGRPVGEVFNNGPDYWTAMKACWKFFPENPQRHHFLDEMEERAQTFVREPLRWLQITTIAEALLERHRLTSSEIDLLLLHATDTVRAVPAHNALASRTAGTGQAWD